MSCARRQPAMFGRGAAPSVEGVGPGRLEPGHDARPGRLRHRAVQGRGPAARAAAERVAAGLAHRPYGVMRSGALAPWGGYGAAGPHP